MSYLPYPIDRPIMQPMQYTPGYGPYVPNDVQPLPNLNIQVLPIIAANMATYISARCNMSPAHMFVYNEQSSNNWNNPKWGATVSMVYYYAALGMSQRMFANEQQAIDQAIKKIAAALTTIAISSYPALAQATPADIVQAAQGMVAEVNAIFQQTQAAVASIRQGYSSPANIGIGQFQMQPQYQPQYQAGYTAQSFGQFGQVSQQQYPQANQPNGYTQVPVNQGIFANQPSGPTLGGSSIPAFNGFAYKQEPAQPVNPQPINIDQQPKERKMNSTVPNNLVVCEDDRIINDPQERNGIKPMGQNIDPLYEPEQSRIYPQAGRRKVTVTITRKGAEAAPRNRIVVKSRTISAHMANQDKAAMDRNQHTVSGAVEVLSRKNPQPAPTQVAAYAPETKDVSMACSSEPVYLPVDAEKIGKAELINEELTLPDVGSLREAAEVGQSVFTSNGPQPEGTIRIQRIDTGVRNTFTTEQSVESICARLAHCGTFAELAAAMQEAVNAANRPHVTKFVAQLDTYLTEKVRYWINERLAIKTMNIDSFMEDAKDIVSAVRMAFGEYIGTIVEVSQREFVHHFMTMYECSEVGVASTVEGESARMVSTVTIKTPVSVFTTDLTSSDLQVQIPRGIFTEVSSKHFPELSNFIRSCNSDPTSLEMCYIQTSDAKLYEIAMSTPVGQVAPVALIREVPWGA